MQRILTAALAALALALVAPAAASAQYDPPNFFPTAYSTPHPPVAGLEDHPFGFGPYWAPDSPLTEDYAEFVAWDEIEADYRMRASAYSNFVYYAYSGLIGTTLSGPTGAGVNWQVRIVRYIPPANDRIGHYCVYEGYVNGPVLAANQNVLTQTFRYCDTYIFSSEDLPGR